MPIKNMYRKRKQWKTSIFTGPFQVYLLSIIENTRNSGSIKARENSKKLYGARQGKSGQTSNSWRYHHDSRIIIGSP